MSCWGRFWNPPLASVNAGGRGFSCFDHTVVSGGFRRFPVVYVVELHGRFGL
nr:MAG TPA: hypothetical protein [Caudoviricetes sp.]